MILEGEAKSFMRYEILDNCLNKRLAQAIMDENYRLILGRGAVITKKYIERLKDYGVFIVAIEDVYVDDIAVNDFVPCTLVIEADKAINNIDVNRISLVADRIVRSMLDDADSINDGFVMLRQYDENTADHSINVAILSVSLGIATGLDADHLKYLATGSLLHDIGKTKISPDILNKKGPLNEREYAEVKKHPEYGYKMVKDDVLMPIPAKAIILQHHENWDGTGYPRRLSGDDIFNLASIVHICDVFDALVSKRSYKEAFSYNDSFEYLRTMKGTMFSPQYIDYFFKYVPVFAVGLTVTLSDGRRGVVVKNNRGNMDSPIVRVNKQDIDLRESELSIIR